MNLSTILHRAGAALATAAFAATLSVAAPQPAQAGVAPVVDTFSTYQFTGHCFDCFSSAQTFLPVGVTLPPDNVGSATLVLKNFPGGAFSASNFVSFSYQSAIFSYDSTAPNETLTNALGAIPGFTAGPGNITLDFINTDTLISTHFEAIHFALFSIDPITLESTLVSVSPEWCIGQNTSNCSNNLDVGDTYTLTEISAVPEPATLALLGAGLLGLGAVRRRRD